MEPKKTNKGCAPSVMRDHTQYMSVSGMLARVALPMITHFWLGTARP